MLDVSQNRFLQALSPAPSELPFGGGAGLGDFSLKESVVKPKNVNEFKTLFQPLEHPGCIHYFSPTTLTLGKRRGLKVFVL